MNRSTRLTRRYSLPLIVSILGALAAVLLLRPGAALAQESDALVVPRGMLSLRAAGTYTHFGALFAGTAGDAGTERAPLGSRFAVPLTSRTFPVLRPIEAELNRFFAFAAEQTGEPAFPIAPQDVQLGAPDVALVADYRSVPIRLEVGVLRRISISATVPAVRTSVDLMRLSLTPGTMGANPDVEFNRGVLSRLDPQLVGLGEADLLPISGSAVGEALQQRIRALSGATDSLRLPAAPADSADLQGLLTGPAFGTTGLAPVANFWRAGDATVAINFQLVNTAGESPYPLPGAGTAYRAAIGLEGRLPTGLARDPNQLFDITPEAGHRGAAVHFANDLFLGDIFWGSATVRYAALLQRQVERRVTSPLEPYAPAAALRALDWDPGDAIELEVVPRLRLTDAISLGGVYRLTRRGEDAYSYRGGDPVLDFDGTVVPASVLNEGTEQTLHEWGGRIAFTTLPSFFAGGTPVPYEVLLSYREAFAATAGTPAFRSFTVEGRILYPLWGRRR